MSCLFLSSNARGSLRQSPRPQLPGTTFAMNDEVNDTEMVAGLVGMKLLDDGTRARPVSGWWVLKDWR